MGQRKSAVGFSALGNSRSGEATTGCAHPCQFTNKTAPACATCAWCQGDKRPSSDKLHDPRAHEQGNVDANWLVV